MNLRIRGLSRLLIDTVAGVKGVVLDSSREVEAQAGIISWNIPGVSRKSVREHEFLLDTPHASLVYITRSKAGFPQEFRSAVVLNGFCRRGGTFRQHARSERGES